MKKFAILLFALTLCLSLAGCSSDTPSQGGQTVSRPQVDLTGDAAVNSEEPSDETPADDAGAGQPLPEFVYSSSLDVYTISGESCVRSGTKVGDLTELAGDEYYSPVLHFQYNGQSTLSWSELCVSVDGEERWYWGAGTLEPGQNMDLHIYYANMQHMSEGSHTIAWYFDGVEVYSDTFMLTHDLVWGALTSLPGRSEIEAVNSTSALRSPYMAVWLQIPAETRYKEYVIEFKSDHFPPGSYFSLGNWYMDFPALEQQYASVGSDSGGINAYAGFQNLYNGDHIGIMSFWDLHCTDGAGSVTTLRPEVIYPADPYEDQEFGGEGVGAKCLATYDWEENHWYRAHFRCVESAATGSTNLEFWVYDLETGEYTLICAYDLKTTDVAFQGSVALFLENFLPSYAGEIRSMEVCNAAYLDEATGQWYAITQADMYPNGDGMGLNYTGSYDYGVEGNRLWILTTGVGSTHDDSAGTSLYLGG